MSNSLPQGWSSCTLADIAAVNPKTVADESLIAGFVPMSHVPTSYHGELLFDEKPWGEIKKSYTNFQDGDVIFAKVTPCFENGKAAIVDDLPNGIGAGSSEFYVLRPHCKDISQKLLFALIKTHAFMQEGTTNMTGAVGLRRVPKSFVETFPIALPPATEQKEITDRLDTLLAQVEATQARLARIPAIINQFRQSVLAAAVSGKLTEEWRGDSQYDSEGFPSSWSRKGLDDLGALARGKSKHRPRNDPRLFGNEYPFIQTGEVAQSNGVIEGSTKWYSKFGLEQSRLFPKGTLCITIAANIADTAILGIDACFPDSVVGFTPIPAVTSALFVKYLIDVNKNSLEQFAPATAQKNINLKVLKSLSLPYPTIEEQTEIVRRVEQLFAYADTIELQAKAAKARVDKLTQAILAKAFRGELTADWRAANPDLISGDNSAVALLARIQAERASNGGKKKKRTLKQ
ncbi:restriction endonuclease subunit S [Aeromonas enteropelogenes]|uniref:restriction endonuclease subunit S n=1 Tax=Aeromonas enteropelogenes TaxID=29489 RepID=UPI00313595B6